MKEESMRGKSNGPPQEMDRPGKIIVTGIPKDDVYSEADLEKEFSPFGRITEAYIVRDRRDRRTNRSRGFAFLTFENPKDAADAMKAMEGKDLGGDRKIHCEQAVIAPRKSDDGHEDSPRGRGSERGRGRGEGRGRGFERGRGEGRGRGMERGWRGGDRGMRGGRGGGRGMEWDEYRGDPRGRGFRGGMMRGRGEGMGMHGHGRGDYFEPDMQGDDYYNYGPQAPHEMPRGRPGRRTLLPNPSFRGQGPPPGPPHRGRGGPPMMRGGGNDYYEEGPEGYYDHDEGRGGYNEGYDEGYQEEEYYDHQPHPNERIPARGGPGGGRGARPLRGRGMAPPHEGMGMSREEMEYSRRGDEFTARRGMGGGDFGGRGSGPMRRGGPSPAPPNRGREGNMPEDYLPPKRQMLDDYGYPAEEGQDLRRKEGPRRAPAGQYPDDEYDYESYPRRTDYYEGAPRGRGGPGGRGGRAPAPTGRGAPGQRRGPRLGHDPYEGEDSGAGYYEASPAQSKAAEHFEDDYSYSRRGQTPARRRPVGGDDSYGGYDAPPAKPSQALDDGYSQKRGIAHAGSGMYDQGYEQESVGNGRRRDDYDNMRQSGIRRPEMEYSSPADDYSRRGSDMYAPYAPMPRSRGTTESREVESDPYARKRHLDYEVDAHVSERSEVHRDYQDFHDRTAGMQSGPSSSKRERYDGFYQSREEEVYREL